MHDHHKRSTLKKGLQAAGLVVLASSGLLLPHRVWAHWPKDAFSAQSKDDVIQALSGDAEWVEDKRINFSVGSPPSYAVDGASVPVEVTTDLGVVAMLALVVARNPQPLALLLEPTPAFRLPFKTLIKIAENSEVYAIVRADNKLYITERFVEIDIGGCA